MSDDIVHRRPQTVVEIVNRWCSIAFAMTHHGVLETAVRYGNVEDVATIVEYGRDCAESEEGKENSIIGTYSRDLAEENVDWGNLAAAAAERNDTEMERYLVSVSQDGAEGGRRRRTQAPALVFRRAETVEEIVVRWCRIARRMKSYEPFLAVLSYGTVEDVATFLERGGDCTLSLGQEDPRLCGYGQVLLEPEEWTVDRQSLPRAIIGNNVEKVRYLISRGANVIADFAMQYAVIGENVEIVRLLLDANADVNFNLESLVSYKIIGPSWQTALHLAAASVRNSRGTDILRLLLDRQADVNVRNVLGHTALHYAKTKPPEMKMLIARGAVDFDT